MRKTSSKMMGIPKFLDNHSLFRFLTVIALLIPVYIVLYKIYIPKISAFGCFDDCFNFAGGYFLERGKILFSEIYFNHQPLMAYISFFIQRFSHPINIYALLLAHRQTLLFFSLLFQGFLIWRFGMAGFVTMMMYEFTKFYVFGDRFLAEGYIIYPFFYLLGLGLASIQNRRLYSVEFIFASVCAWFVVFMREPFIPLAFLLFLVIIRKKIRTTAVIISICIFLSLTVFLFLLFPVGDYIDNVIVVNFSRGLIPGSSSLTSSFVGLSKSFFYPLYIFVNGKWNDFRIILLILSSLYILSFVNIMRTKKNIILPLFLTIVLGLSNLRPTEPGVQYYEAFHMLVWYGLFIFSTIYIFYDVASHMGRQYIFYIVTVLLILYICFSPRSFIYQKTDSHTEFITNYGHYIAIGEVIKALSQENQTMFTDGNEELLYWQANRPSPYQYSFYYPAGENSKYYSARLLMFAQNPPDFYYDFCTPNAPYQPSIPSAYISLYHQLSVNGKPSCLYLKSSLIPAISSEQWKKAKEFEYMLSEN